MRSTRKRSSANGGRQNLLVLGTLLSVVLGGLGVGSGNLLAAENPTPLESPAATERPSFASLIDAVSPFHRLIQGENRQFKLEVTANLTIDSKPQTVVVELLRYDDESFDLRLNHPDYQVEIRRTKDVTAFALPKHRVVFLGQWSTGAEDQLTVDQLAPRGSLQRLISSGCQIATYLPSVLASDSSTVIQLASSLIDIRQTDAPGGWAVGDAVRLNFSQSGTTRTVEVKVDDFDVTARLSENRLIADSEHAISWSDYEVRPIKRAELERHLSRGVRRALEVLLPSPLLTSPAQIEKTVDNGTLRYVEGQRLVTLWGTPEEIGTAHGKLLKRESQRCVDSVLYAFGTAQTIATGRWFRDDLEQAYASLKPYIPNDHLVETRALAVALGHDPDVLEVLNVFPELFHCSGFAVANSATVDGKLYHGRVLDYMTTIGLQDCATTFVVSVNDKIPFANVGYAAFTGSVSGMNARAISLGEMGGRGEGQWDGVPMATLMRRAMEECKSLDQVMALWTDNPRTCEYYYVFADGKTNQAVGVAATPAEVQFIKMGEGHELLGEGIADAVLLSAGDRLELLRQRVNEQHGKIDAEAAMRLMDRPVAMNSNLHNVLFVPADGVFYVANADHNSPAADRPYVRYDLNALLAQQVAQAVLQRPASVIGRTFQADDTLDIGDDPNADAAACLRGLAWQPTSFDLTCEAPRRWQYDSLVRFPSPIDSGDAVNDLVSMEWHMARNADGEFIRAPALIVVHESGRKMPVGRTFAMLLSRVGLHTFMVELPGYGNRIAEGTRPGDEQWLQRMKQSVADVRRARDAAAALPLVDTSHIGIQGTSLGGFVAATAAGLDTKFDSVFIMLAGGDLYGTITNGNRDAADLREKLAAKGIAGDGLRELLSAVEPNRIAHRLRPDRTWLFSGRTDDVVPLENALSFASKASLDSEHHIILEADHYSGAIMIPEMVIRVRDEVLRSNQQ